MTLIQDKCLEEVAQDFSSQMLATSFFVIHDSSTSCQHDVSKTGWELRKLRQLKPISNSPKLTAWQKCVGPFLNVEDGHIEARTDDSSLIQSSREVHNDLSCSVIIDDFEFSNVAVLHHHRKELDDDLRVGSDEDLTLSAFFSIVDALQGIGENRNSNHWKESNRKVEVRKIAEIVFHKTGTFIAFASMFCANKRWKRLSSHRLCSLSGNISGKH